MTKSGWTYTTSQNFGNVWLVVQIYTDNIKSISKIYVIMQQSRTPTKWKMFILRKFSIEFS